MQFRLLGWEDPLEEGMATHSSICAWRIPWTKEPGWLQSMGLHGVGHNWGDLACTYASPISSHPSSTQKQEDLRLVMGRKGTGRLGKENQRLLEGCSGCSWPTSVQFSSVAQSCLTLCDSMNCSMAGLPVHHQFPECTQTHAHRVSDAIQPSHPLSSPSPPALNPSQHQDLFQWVNSSHEVAKVLEFQLQHQSFQWTPRTDLL